MDPRVKKIKKGLYEFRGKTIRRDYSVFSGQRGAWYAEARGRTCHEANLQDLIAYLDKVLGPQKKPRIPHRG